MTNDDGPTIKNFPAFARDIDATLAVHAHFVISGNIRDRYFVPDKSGELVPADILNLLWELLQLYDFEILAVFDPIDGLRSLPEGASSDRTVQSILGDDVAKPAQDTLTHLQDIIRAVSRSDRRIGLAVNYASRLVANAEQLEPEELDFFRFCEKNAENALPKFVENSARPLLMNPIFWLLHQDRDLPSWLTADSQAFRIVPISHPSIKERSRAAAAIARSVPDLAQLPERDEADFVEAFAGSSDGLTIRSMLDVIRLATDRDIGYERIDDAVRAYRVGMVDNPWKDEGLIRRVRNGEEQLPGRVLGQGHAVEASLDVLKRSVLGMGSAQSKNSTARPRGVLFFAGPTGVGKTELAKSIAEVVFGDRNAYLRFDMSEFSADHSDARLIGAPPGYKGYDVGGELTNGIREQPFRLLLFDEIEKAHPRILDKFLQILDDGRLTDARGSTVHFSETFIVFTSNLGIYIPEDDPRSVRWVPNPDIWQGMPYDELRVALRSAIANHFTEFLNRPELLNRIGTENLVIFDFIQADVAKDIFNLRLEEFLEAITEELDLKIEVTDEIRSQLCDLCVADLSDGGRGIENKLRAKFVNPLARAIFALDPRPATTTVTSIRDLGDDSEVTLS